MTDGLPRVLLWGGRSQARIIAEMLKETGLGRVVIVFDHTLQDAWFQSDGIFINDVKILKREMSAATHFVACIGGEHGFARYKIAECLQKLGLSPLPVCHPRSFVDSTVRIGAGHQVMPFAIIHKFSEIGEQAILNTNSTVDHECVIGKGVHIMGNAAVTGRVTIGSFATIGTNATILPDLNIGEGAFVGAGAVVTADVEPYTVMTGVPARKSGKVHFEYNANLVEGLL